MEDAVINLDASVERVIVQFKMRDPGNLPKVARQMARNRKNPGRESGKKVIDDTPNVSMVEFVRELEVAGFELVDLFHDERDFEGMGAYQVYHVGRFVFVRKELAYTTLESGQANLARIELHLLCAKSLWRVCGYLNPIRRNGEVVAGRQEVSINLDSRRPLFDNDGKPVCVWPKSKKSTKSRQAGDQPTPLGPKHLLIVKDGAINVAAVSVPAPQKTEAVATFEPEGISIPVESKPDGISDFVISPVANSQMAMGTSPSEVKLKSAVLRMNYNPAIPRYARQIPGKRGHDEEES